jgi:membrane-associated phospholipid phosphatase
MTSELALDESPQTPSPSSPSNNSIRIRIARSLSNILSPVTVSLPFVFLVAFYHAPNLLTALLYTCLVLVFLTFGPMVYVLVGVRIGKFTDADVSVRSQRFGPFLFGIISALIGLVSLLFTHGPKNLQTLLLLTIISGIVMFVITLWWKISIHASSLAAAATMLIALYGRVMLLAFALLLAVCWSRVVLRRHTVAQVVAGSMVSIALTSLLLFIRGV